MAARAVSDREGDRVTDRESVEARFWPKVLMVENCWEWLGAITGNGYGGFWDGKRYGRAHRISYELFRGPIPAGLGLDHTCGNRRCVNPWHLEPVTQRENVRRGDRCRRLVCASGHEEYGLRGDGSRYCLACNRERVYAFRAKYGRRPRCA